MINLFLQYFTNFPLSLPPPSFVSRPSSLSFYLKVDLLTQWCEEGKAMALSPHDARVLGANAADYVHDVDKYVNVLNVLNHNRHL